MGEEKKKGPLVGRAILHTTTMYVLCRDLVGFLFCLYFVFTEYEYVLCILYSVLVFLVLPCLVSLFSGSLWPLSARPGGYRWRQPPWVGKAALPLVSFFSLSFFPFFF